MPSTTRSQTRKSTSFLWASAATILFALAHAVGALHPDVLDTTRRIVALVGIGLPVTWLVHRWMTTRDDESDLSLDMQMAAAVLTTSFVVADIAGSFGIDFFPVIYLILAILVAFQPRAVGIASVIFALALTLAPWAVATWLSDIWLAGEVVFETAEVLTRTGFVVVFGSLASIVHGAEVLERRRRHRLEVEEERASLLRQARELRLLSTRRVDVEVSREEKVELITRDAVDAVNHAIFVSLSLLKTGLNCNTCILLWFDVRGEQLRIKELISESDSIVESSIDPAKGVIGGITRRREAMRLDGLKPGFRGFVYYRENPSVTDFVGVPVLEDGHLRGVLAVDRVGNHPFTDDEVELVEHMAEYVVRAVENERTFASIEKSKHELGRFFEASRRLNGALSPSEVYEVALESAQEIVPYHFAAITLVDEDTGIHSIVAVDGTDVFEDADEWQSLEFEANSGLVSMVVKNRHYLPFGGVLRDESPVVFERDQDLTGLNSLLVLPLLVQDKTIGTFIVGHCEPNRFPGERREMLEVVSNQVAVTLQNARLYSQMEEMASTDGLTGLANHRTFQSKLDEAIARHRRMKKPFATLLTDIDHFKDVNDTHGHPIGDEVLRQVSKCFQNNLRETDFPARYGGEEFAIILEDTELEGAMVIAERLRSELKKLVFQGVDGPFSCTISIGVGYWPSDSEDKQTLVEYTDQALYHSKHNGRDRVTAYQSIARKAS